MLPRKTSAGVGSVELAVRGKFLGERERERALLSTAPIG